MKKLLGGVLTTLSIAGIVFGGMAGANFFGQFVARSFYTPKSESPLPIVFYWRIGDSLFESLYGLFLEKYGRSYLELQEEGFDKIFNNYLEERLYSTTPKNVEYRLYSVLSYERAEHQQKINPPRQLPDKPQFFESG